LRSSLFKNILTARVCAAAAQNAVSAGAVILTQLCLRSSSIVLGVRIGFPDWVSEVLGVELAEERHCGSVSAWMTLSGRYRVLRAVRPSRCAAAGVVKAPPLPHDSCPAQGPLLEVVLQVPHATRGQQQPLPRQMHVPGELSDGPAAMRLGEPRRCTLTCTWNPSTFKCPPLLLLQANHRGWSDFFIDMYVSGCRGVPLSRWDAGCGRGTCSAH
jgi:hypothetical protein